MTTNRELFAKHSELRYFIETGSCFGRSIKIALEVGFPEVRSVEAHNGRYLHCAREFAGDGRVKLWCGESVPTLPDMIKDVSKPALFWLDAHPSGDDSYGQNYEQRPELHQHNVLAAELRIIYNRSVKGDVILIDDLAPRIGEFVVHLFQDCIITVHDTDEGMLKVLEIET